MKRAPAAILCFALAVLVAAMLLPSAAAAHRSRFYWTLGKTMGEVEGARIRVGDRVLRVRAATTLCSGQGDRVRRSGRLRWRHFACTYTVFHRGIPGRDVEFRLHVVGRERFVTTNTRWVV